jgi:hypothetical protein
VERKLRNSGILFGWPQLGAFGEHATIFCLEELPLIFYL